MTKKEKTPKDIDRYQLSDEDQLYALGYRAAVTDMLSSFESIKFDMSVEEPFESVAKLIAEILDEAQARLSETGVDNYYYTLEALESGHIDEEEEDEEEEIPF